MTRKTIYEDYWDQLNYELNNLINFSKKEKEQQAIVHREYLRI